MEQVIYSEESYLEVELLAMPGVPNLKGITLQLASMHGICLLIMKQLIHHRAQYRAGWVSPSAVKHKCDYFDNAGA